MLDTVAPRTIPDDLAVAEAALAGLGARATAFVLDTVVVWGVTVGSTQLLPFSDEDWYWIGFLVGIAMPVLAPAFFLIVLPISFATSAWAGCGATPGKIAMRIAIRDAGTGELPRFTQLLHREFSRGWRIVLFLIPTLIDHAAAFQDPRRQTRHDAAARTIVVRSRPSFVRSVAASLAFSFGYVAVVAATSLFVYALLLG